jgi:DeoR/GlpR family transcriptional regulator of sugar metabolism
MMNDSSLLAIERQRRISEVLQREGSVRTAELTELLNVSAVTIRSDLRELEKVGECQIIWGGAVSQRPPQEAESVLEHRSELHRESKRRIGKKAAGFVEVGQTIFVDAGTTTVEIIKHLPSDFDYLRVVTPALNVAMAATYHTYIELVMPGGILRNLTRSLIGAQTLRSLEIFNADILFLASGGFSVEHGVTTGNLLEVEVKRTMVAHAKKVILTADSSKFGRILSLKVAPISAIDTIITDNQLSDSDTQTLKQLGVDVLRV